MEDCEKNYLVKEDIFSVLSILRIFFKDPFWADPMLHTQLLPELTSDCKK
jgi:hypothetical protein